jgi:probable rRNA maturation factor
MTPSAGRGHAGERRRRVPLAVDIEGAGRPGVPAAASLRRWARLAAGGRGSGRRLALRLVTRPESRRLNAHWRGRDCATNVLSFQPPPAFASSELGDIAICPAVVRAEARAQCKPLRHHWAHLVVHGCLHLLGHDHGHEHEARCMERREIALLARLGIGNPYLPQRSS